MNRHTRMPLRGILTGFVVLVCSVGCKDHRTRPESQEIEVDSAEVDLATPDSDAENVESHQESTEDHDQGEIGDDLDASDTDAVLCGGMLCAENEYCAHRDWHCGLDDPSLDKCIRPTYSSKEECQLHEPEPPGCGCDGKVYESACFARALLVAVQDTRWCMDKRPVGHFPCGLYWCRIADELCYEIVIEQEYQMSQCRLNECLDAPDPDACLKTLYPSINEGGPCWLSGGTYDEQSVLYVECPDF